ncbi:MAG: ThiF family adenylyltransferase, partial [Proteobacteria bacterium]|nr:ThiF family adenylyltransferase [Desulfobulbaceae bacterium]MBU4154470.1 ThiF family adenylyltransferase [Pseudomonadota bacterium]
MIRVLETSTPELRDGVEVFLYPVQEGSSKVLFLFLSSRRRLRIKCKPAYAGLLKQFARHQPLASSMANVGLDLNNETINFISFLNNEGIITIQDPLETNLLPVNYVEQYKRQIYFLIDILKSPQKALEVQRKIFDAHITIFGLGAIGSAILLQLCMMGFRQFTLIDYAQIEADDIARTMYKTALDDGKQKTQAARTLAEETAFDPYVQTYDTTIKTTTELNDIIRKTSIIINTADQPYIGYTNIKLSRYALNRGIPLLVAGGFDAHLASFGELLIPHVTPCADCYATFFEDSLKNWKPIPHPVKERQGWFGGLGSLSAFSSSVATLKILSYFLDQVGDDKV